MRFLSWFLLMAYPYQVDTAANSQLTTNTSRNQGPGLFRYGSAQFSVFRNTATNRLQVRKSINRGVSWSVADNAGSKPIPAEGAGFDRAWYSAVLDPVGNANLIWVMWVAPTTFVASFASFNMATELWGVTTTGGPGSMIDPVLGMQVPLIGPGQPYLFYQGPDEGGFDRQYYVALPISAGIWGIPARLSDSAGEAQHFSTTQGVVTDKDGRMHVAVLVTTAGNAIWIRSIDRNGLKGPWAIIVTAPGGAGNRLGDNSCSPPFVTADGTTVAISYAIGTNTPGSAWSVKVHTAAAAQSPVWSEQTAAITTREEIAQSSTAGAYAGSQIFVSWERMDAAGVAAKYYYAIKRSGVWGAITTLYDTGVTNATSSSVAAYPVSGGVGVFFDFGIGPSFQPWYWELRTAGNMNSILGASRQPKVA